MATTGTEAEREGKVDAALYEVREGRTWAVRGREEFDLGPADAAHDAMTDHLAQVDFGA